MAMSRVETDLRLEYEKTNNESVTSRILQKPCVHFWFRNLQSAQHWYWLLNAKLGLSVHRKALYQNAKVLTIAFT